MLVIAGVWFAANSTIALNAAAARDDIEARLGDLTGQPVFVGGEMDFEFLPRPVLTLADVRIGGVEPGLGLSVDRIVAELDFLDAVLGRTDVARLTLIRPELASNESASAPVQDRAPATAPSPPPAGAEAAEDGAYGAALLYLRSFFTRFEGVRAVEIRDGVFRPNDGSLGFSNANLTLDWPSRSAPATIAGNFVWNGQPTTVTTHAERPVAFLDGESSAVRLLLEAPPLDLSFEGVAQGGDAIGLDGSLRIATPSVTRAARWLGRGGSTLPDFGAASIVTRLVLRNDRAALEGARLGFDGQEGEGALEALFRNGGSTAITGTLAFPQLDLDRFARAVAPLPRHALDLQRPLALSFIDEFDLDLRLSASAASFAGFSVRQFAAAVIFQDGRATLDVGDAEILGGRAQGRLSIDTRQPRPVASARIDLSGVSSGDIAALAGIDSVRLAGPMNLTAELAGPAGNWSDILRQNETRIRVSMASGSVTGLSADVFRTAGERKFEVDPQAPPTAFSAMSAELTTKGPYANLESVRITVPQGVVEASGFLSVMDDQMMVDGTFEPAATSAAANVGASEPFTSSQEIGFTMRGEWPAPTIFVGSSERPI